MRLPSPLVSGMGMMSATGRSRGPGPGALCAAHRPAVPQTVSPPQSEGFPSPGLKLERQHRFWTAVSSSRAMALAQLSQWPALPWSAGAPEGTGRREMVQPHHHTDITPFLEAVSLREMKHIRKLSNLCGLSYKTSKIHEKGLKRRHNLDLVAASWTYQPSYNDPKTAADMLAEGDGMAASVEDLRLRCLPSDEDTAESKAASQPATVATKLAEAAMAASAAATALAEFTASKFSGSSNNADRSQAASAVLGLSSSSIGLLSSARYLSAAASQPTYSCPSEWFICDDPKEQLRIFVIQGSNSIDHWKLNLAFDPVVFEDPALGVSVHRGVYEAAAVLYDKFLPLVYEHLDTSPLARVTFTGHSIGGCMAMLLMLMFKKRGVLKSNNIAPVYTFGSPSVFCSGSDASGSSCDWDDWDDAEPPQEASSQGCRLNACGPGNLLASLGLAETMVRHVFMHRDIVPRAFSCDYSAIADILKGWGPSFRSDCCADGGAGTTRKHLFSVCGTMLVLQPARQHAFVSNNPDHPLLPPGPGLYVLTESPASPPPRRSSPAHRSLATDAGADADAEPDPPTPTTMQQPARKVPSSAREAVQKLMDNPHPLEMLADPASYLEKGQISRFHNPDHLTQALGQLIHLANNEKKQHM